MLKLVIYCIIIVLASGRFSLSTSGPKKQDEKVTFFKPVIDSLLKRGVDSEFIYSLVLNPKTQFQLRYVKINVTGYLSKTDYSANYNFQAVTACRTFINEHFSTLIKCEEYYDVPKEVVTAVLYIETKLGSFLGNHHLPSVFLSTAMAEKKEFIDQNFSALRETGISDTNELKDLTKKIVQRAKSKSQWALKEIEALYKMKNKSPESVMELEGSWAGAFGMSQFLPSSYLRWAVDGNSDGKIDLYDDDDAILSIGNYLKSNGWGEPDSLQKKALFHYNNSTAYVDAVLKLAEKTQR